MLFADHHQQDIARIGRLARAEHHRVRPYLFNNLHQSDHLRGHELRVPTSVQEPVDVQEFSGTTANPQRGDQKTVWSINTHAHAHILIIIYE